jgi:C1A family cysteine protease
VLFFATLLLFAGVVVSVEWGIESEIVELLGESENEGEFAALSDVHAEGIAMDEAASFKAFAQFHKKKYGSRNEYQQRFSHWKKNLDFVRQWNGDTSKSFKLAMNEFADLSDGEFETTYLNPKMHDEFLKSETFLAAEEMRKSKAGRMKMNADVLADISSGDHTSDQVQDSPDEQFDIRWHKNTGSQPADMDWHKKSATTEVNNQAKCFACYAFAACGAIEGAKFINTGKMVKLSAQQIVDCSREVYRNHGCKGGTMVKSYKYIIEHGLMKDVDYGYNTILNSQPSCKTTHSTCKYNKSKVQQRIVGYVNVREGDEVDLMNAVAQRPVSVAIDAHHRAFKLYHSGVFSLDSCTTHLTHGVLMVGYGEASGQKYWKIKNSWGKTWGSEGYGHVIRGKNMCSIADWSNYPIIDKDDQVSTTRSLEQVDGAPETELLRAAAEEVTAPSKN